ncbi:hypothetical protein FBUS_09629 [Fasciolopsis buskii]|uniref:Uncharacterized protein n=1 Tax=Fasciolopsis buskii TaxID=27845 RepID=A0A8E0S195_9TREM|nr:hypothetical protein FBUS_09629 [Fasciolopsis buski]
MPVVTFRLYLYFFRDLFRSLLKAFSRFAASFLHFLQNQVPVSVSSSFDPFGTLQKDPFETRSSGPSTTVAAAIDPFGSVATATLRDPMSSDPFSTFGSPKSNIPTVSVSQPALSLNHPSEAPYSVTWAGAFMPASTSQMNFATSSMGDKYAALAELDGMFKNATVTTTSSTVLPSVAIPNQTAMGNREPLKWSETFVPPTNSFFGSSVALAPVNTVQLPPSTHNPFAPPMVPSAGVQRQYSASNPFISNQSVPCVSGSVVPPFQALSSTGISLGTNPAGFPSTHSGGSNPFHTPVMPLPISRQITWTSHLNSNPTGPTPIQLGTTFPAYFSL